MASVFFSLVLSLSSLFLLSPTSPTCYAVRILKSCGINTLYQLGDSTSDTGNLIQEQPESVFARLPYGETFFKNATGRCSDGLLIIDYFAISARLPFVDAYLNPDATLYNRDHGVNFAVAGSTALPSHILADKKILCPVTNSSLSTQLDWMFTYFNGICYNDADCAEKLKNSLFIVGEIGGNDYRYALFQGKTPEEVKAMVPEVVQAIKDAVAKVIGYGAARVVVPGNFPIGCFPIYLTEFHTNDSAAYDEFHCLTNLNNLSLFHNEELQQAIQELKTQHPEVAIVYGDYYKAFLWIVRHIRLLGFDAKSVQKACCGIGGDYNFDLTKMCGFPGVPVCQNPHKRISWDGVHLTQKAYYYMAMWLVRSIYSELHC